MTTRRSGLALAALLLAAAAIAAPGPAGEAEQPDCIASPGVQDDFGFTHRIEVFLDGHFWYFQAPELELDFDQNGQPQDLPGHCWSPGPNVGGLKHYVGKHYDTGPLGMGGQPGFWSSDAGDHELLYWVDLVISPWSPEIAQRRALEGYVHYHELVLKDDGCYHPELVAWLRHTSLRDFTFDGGPPQRRENGLPFRPRNEPHDVHPGLDLSFPPNYDVPYLPELFCSGE